MWGSLVRNFSTGMIFLVRVELGVLEVYMLFCQIAKLPSCFYCPWINGTYYLLLHVMLLVCLYVGICDSLAGVSVIG